MKSYLRPSLSKELDQIAPGEMTLIRIQLEFGYIESEDCVVITEPNSNISWKFLPDTQAYKVLFPALKFLPGGDPKKNLLGAQSVITINCLCYFRHGAIVVDLLDMRYRAFPVTYVRNGRDYGGKLYLKLWRTLKKNNALPKDEKYKSHPTLYVKIGQDIHVA